jgi:hypothetical protein
VNPYTPSLKLLFYSLENIFREMLRNEQAGQSVVLIAGRRCGKTCLMERLYEFLRRAAIPANNLNDARIKAIPDAKEPGLRRGLPTHWPVHINFQGMRFQSFEKVMHHIAQAIADSNPLLTSVLSPCSSVAKKFFDFLAVPAADGFDAGQMESWLRQVDGRLGEANLGGLDFDPGAGIFI